MYQSMKNILHIQSIFSTKERNFKHKKEAFCQDERFVNEKEVFLGDLSISRGTQTKEIS
mgnify:CR=1 FL=1